MSISKIFNQFYKIIVETDFKKIALFWIAYTIIGGFIFINQIDIKQIFGTYHPKEIQLNNVFIEVVGRTNAKSILIHTDSNEYQAKCMNKYNLFCENFFRKGIAAEEIKLIQMVDNKGFLIYSKFLDPYSKQTIIIDSINAKEDLKIQYEKGDNFIRFIIVIPICFTIFFSLIAILKSKYSKIPKKTKSSTT